MPIPRRAPGLPPQFRPSPQQGGPLTPLPLVATVGVSGLGSTAVTLVGSVNPQGQSGNWWFTYGTTPQMGTTTASTAVVANSLPQTVTVYLSGLTTNTTYYFAPVCSTAGGTVTAAPLSFTPNVQPAVTNASNPIVSQATPAVTTPHYSWPFTITNSGAQVVEQDSTGEIVACVNAIAACQIGQCPELPTFGIPDLTFLTAPMDTSSLLQAVQTWEPRAQPSTVVSAMDQIGAGWNVQLTDTFTQSSGQ